MTQTATQAPIDLIDTKVQLTVVLEMETKLLDHLKQQTLVGDDNMTIYVAPVAWLLVHGYISELMNSR